jgi:hypothetical protein
MPDPNDAFEDADHQDGAESLDETNYDLSEDGVGEMRTFEELPDVLDVTQAEGDSDDDEALALNADEFDEEAVDDSAQEDNELDFRAATAEREDDLDGQGPEDGYDEDRVAAGGVEGLDEVGDADTVEGGEDDLTDFQADDIGDDDLKRMGYSESRGGQIRAKPDDV